MIGSEKKRTSRKVPTQPEEEDDLEGRRHHGSHLLLSFYVEFPCIPKDSVLMWCVSVHGSRLRTRNEVFGKKVRIGSLERSVGVRCRTMVSP